MNRYADDRSKEHADDAQRLLECLREVGAAGITTSELIREGCCGLRPPNRVGDLRRQGHLIETIREGNGVFRYRLTHENPNPKPLPTFRQKRLPLSDLYIHRVKTDSKGDPVEDRQKELPLFTTTARRSR